MWTDDEKDALARGVKKYGIGASTRARREDGGLTRTDAAQGIGTRSRRMRFSDRS